MPTYQYLCDSDDGGCGEVTEVNCLMSEIDDKQVKSCPSCAKRKPLRRLFGCAEVHIQHTLGSFADKHQSHLSEDERHHIHKKNNKYREHDGQPSFVQVGDKLVHRSNLE